MILPYQEKCRRFPAAFEFVQLLVVLALLIGDAAAGLASGLARSLALTAATILGAVTQILGLDGLDMLHGRYLHKIVLIDDSTSGE